MNTMECPGCGLDLGGFDRLVDATLHYDECLPEFGPPAPPCGHGDNEETGVPGLCWCRYCGEEYRCP